MLPLSSSLRHGTTAALCLLAAMAVGLDRAEASPINVPNPLTVGSLTFSNFDCSIISSGAAGPTACSSILASALNPNAISINGAFAALGTAAGLSREDVVLTFEVSSPTPIGTVGLGFNGVAVGTGIASVTESLGTSLIALNDLGQLSVSTNSALSASTNLLTSATSFFVTKDILLDAFGPGSSATTSVITQSFGPGGNPPPPVPEPASWSLFAVALLGMAAYKARSGGGGFFAGAAAA
jgi:hypothetical protein